MKILFVCLGNICRSPLAEGIFMHKIVEKGLKMQFSADSCGTSNYHIGQPPDPRTIENAKENGVVLRHLGRQVSPADLVDYDLIIPMDRSNRDGILSLENAGQFSNKIHLMREFDSDGEGEDVPDPYHGSERDFQDVFEILDRSVDGLIAYLVDTSPQTRKDPPAQGASADTHGGPQD